MSIIVAHNPIRHNIISDILDSEASDIALRLPAATKIEQSASLTPQSTPSLRSGVSQSRSPTESIQSLKRKASKEALILHEQHRIAPPTHTAVLKLGHQTKESLSTYQRNLGNRITRHNKRHPDSPIAGHYSREILPDGTIHLHLLLRTGDTETFIRLAKTEAWIQPIETVTAATKYNVGDILQANYTEEDCRRHPTRKTLLLFEKGYRVNKYGTFGHYFTLPKAELWDRAKRRLEIQRIKREAQGEAPERSEGVNSPSVYFPQFFPCHADSLRNSPILIVTPEDFAQACLWQGRAIRGSPIHIRQHRGKIPHLRFCHYVRRQHCGYFLFPIHEIFSPLCHSTNLVSQHSYYIQTIFF